MEILLLLVLFFGIAAAGVTQAVAGTGVRLIIPPLAILVCGHAEGLRIALALGLLISVVMFLGERREVAFRAFAAIALPLAITAPLWVWLVGLIPAGVAARLAGLVGVGALVVTLLGLRTGKSTGRPGAIGAGAAASGLFALGGVGGPVLGIYARDNQWVEPQARAVINACIALAQMMILGVMGLPTVTKPGFGVGLAALGLGVVLGGLAVKRLPKLTAKRARTAAIILAGVCAVVLLLAGTLV